jgi:tetratricopeptide (TPR) repeat protein
MLGSCNHTKTNITTNNDYELFLNNDSENLKSSSQKELAFWSEKLDRSPNQYPYLVKMAFANAALFEITGKVDYLIQTENKLTLANEKTNFNNAGYLRSLARNYISQHRFKEALNLLKKAENNGEKLVFTQKMLFDVHLELGNYKEAQDYLALFKNFKDFDYLIRLSKWNDHNGNLDAAIRFMENATFIAETTGNTNLVQWSYTNLADFYGHANRIEDSYEFYLKALELNPNDAYAKKGIAWIVYSHERNPTEALRILDSITKNFHSPDYFLLKAEIEEYMGNQENKRSNIEQYLSLVSNENYGAMYNKYKTVLYLEELNKNDAAFSIANEEIKERPTPQSYDLLAWSYYNDNEPEKALEVVNKYIQDKTFEPEIQYHMAEIFKANGMGKSAMKIKSELLGSVYELGPIMEQKINNL